MSATRPVWRASESAAAGFPFRHPLDASSGCVIAPLSRLGGLESLALNLVTVAPGQRAFPHHTHHGEEEWVFVVSGTAELRLADESHALAPGDFAAFPRGGPAHSVRNSGPGDLVCLMGGEKVAAEVIDFPELGKRVTWTGAGMAEAPASAFTAFSFTPGDGS